MKLTIRPSAHFGPGDMCQKPLKEYSAGNQPIISKECLVIVTKSGSKSHSAKASDSSVVTPLRGRNQAPSNLESDLLILKEQLRQIEKQLANLPEFNASKVVDLHNRIEAGEYEIDPERIAHKIMELESEINSN